jgi:hypothetical protein
MASNQTFIIAAYAVTWVVLLGTLVRLVRRGRIARAEFQRVAHEYGKGNQQ